MQTLNKKLLEDYCTQILGTQQEILSFNHYLEHITVVFCYDENYVYQENAIISLFDLISFVYSKI